MEASQVSAHLEKFGLDSSRVQYDVDVYRIVYLTVAPDGNPITASGLVAFPRSGDRDPRVVAWLHGTTVDRHEVASVNEKSFDRAAAFLFASAGYVASAPDYLGLGVGRGYHPYGHLPSTVTAAVDALRATRTLAARKGRRIDKRVLISGHSQGGHAAMALGRALQRGTDPDLSLGGLAPIAGPHHYSATLSTALSGDIANTVPYVAYWTVAWNRLHHLYGSPSEAFLPHYDKMLEGLFDHEHTAKEVFGELPATLPELFNPQFLARLQHPTGALLEALKEADSACDWRPQVPVLLLTSRGDRDVPIANADYCQQVLRSRRADVQLVDLGDVDHIGAGRLGISRALEEFEQYQ